MANMNTQLTTTGALSIEMQSYYDRLLLENMKPKLVHYDFGQKRPLPRNKGKTIEFRKFTPFGAITTPLTEGVVPDGQNLALTEVTATVASYGDYVAVSDLLDLTAIDPIISEATELMGDQAALSVDTIIREVLHAGTNVMYASTATSRATVAQSMKLTTTEVRKAVRTLKKGKAMPFNRNGKSVYIAIVGPDTTYDLQSDTLWQDVSKYQDKEQIYSGEIGRIFGCVFVETTQAKIFTGAGASGADVASTLFLGQNAYGVVDIENGSTPKTIVKPAGSAGTSDPLEQISTVGWKVPAFTATVLQQLFMLRCEHGISA